MTLVYCSVTCASILLASSLVFFFNDTATTEIYTLSLHDALPICAGDPDGAVGPVGKPVREEPGAQRSARCRDGTAPSRRRDRKSTRLNSSHGYISYAVFCLKKKKRSETETRLDGEKSPARQRRLD